MLKYIKYILTTILISFLIFELIVWGIIVQKKGVFTSSYQNIIVDKYRILQNTNGKKIVLISGSSSSFGLDQKMLENKTGYKVCNLGLHAGFGNLFYTELAKENINKGDIVLLGYEYGWSNNFESLGQQLIMTGIDNNIDMYKHIPINHWKDFIGYIFKYAADKNAYTSSSGNYSREAFNPKTGQMTWPRYYAMSDYFNNISTYGQISILDENGNVSIANNSIEYLKKLKKFVEGKGANIYFVSSPILYESISCDINDFLKLVKLEEEKIGIPYISDPRLYMFPIDLMANSINHCNSEGEKIRTSILIDDLQLCGAIKSDEISDTVKTEYGETFVLVDLLPKRLLHRPKTIESVYSIDPSGNYTKYKEGTDYIIDYKRGTIRRTDSSNIPNYSKHHVKYVSGKFTQLINSNNHNPESNKKYQIYVDYKYRVNQKELQPIGNNCTYLSDRLKNKILSQKNINIALCGDSIGAGTDTNKQDVFLNYIAESLKRHYNIEVNTSNFSANGKSSDFLIKKLSDIIDLHPDVIMIEFGMNDHCNIDSTSNKKVNHFKNNIKNAIDVLQKNDIDIILIGFPQQNMTWDKENIEATKQYNDALQEIANTENVFFANVYDIFYQVGNIKPLSRDVMTDFIHHPSEWGHKLYYTSIIEVFNLDGKMKPIDLPNYIYIK